MRAVRSRQPTAPEPLSYTRPPPFPRAIAIGLSCLVSMSVAWFSAAVSCRAAEPVATPQRPSFSFGTGTVPDRMWELEAGGLVTAGGSAVPLFLKHGLTDRTELEVGMEAVLTAEGPTGVRSSIGDLFLGVRSRRSLDAGRAAAVVGWIKFPTAAEGVGSTHTDAGAVGVLSLPLGGLSLDTNLWLSAHGRDGGVTVGRVLALASLGIPLRDCWSSYTEVVVQRTAGEGSGGYVNAGMACAASNTSVFDVSIGAGWDAGFPDWTMAVGWTHLFARE